MSDPSLPVLAGLFSQGYARVSDAWKLTAPQQLGLWWRQGVTAVATPALLRLGEGVADTGEQAGLLLACEARYRDAWMNLQAARLSDLGQRKEESELCRQIETLGAAAGTLRDRLSARLEASDHTMLELGVFGAPADQAAAAPGVLRVLAATAPLLEGDQGVPAEHLSVVDARDPEPNWCTGRLIQAPGAGDGGGVVLAGAVPDCEPDRIAWVLGTPWVTLLTALVFTAEAWASERHGGLQLELPIEHIQQFAHPPRVDITVTLSDGREVLCGSLGAYCLRVLDALGMAMVPTHTAEALDGKLSRVIGVLLASGVWRWIPESRPFYAIGERFSLDCYRGDGHRYIYLGAERLCDVLRGEAIKWATERLDSPQERR